MTNQRLGLIPQLPDLDKIRQMRKRLNLSQRELAAMAGVSQSLIAKIERGSIDPSYSNVRKILGAFEEVLRKRKVEGVKLGAQLSVGDLATRGVIIVTPEQTVAECVDRMMKGRFTQLPVIVGDRVVGGITDDSIRDYTIEETRNGRKTYDGVMQTRVEDVMSAPFPILSEDTPIELASVHLQREEAVLVSRKGQIVGILTSADFLNLGLNQ
ncbi:MAG: helix-turn-helix domain-containing protein [Methanomassiliicoccales archaeon]|jgi:predicted transcriptional regulator|nr:helix-turn-helix domain-containing protein [Methanomassiliicoccales archaeon]